MEISTERSIFAPRPAPKASPSTLEDHENLCAELQALIKISDTKQSKNYAILLAITETQKLCVPTLEACVNILIDECPLTVKTLMRSLRKKGMITEEISTRAHELMGLYYRG